MTQRDSQKIALVTGASRGLGAAIAELLSADYHIVAVGRTTGALEELDDRIQASGGGATLAPMDITNRDAMAQLCRGIYDRWGQLAIWVHTAAHTAPLAPADHVGEKDWTRSMAVNATAMGHLVPFIAPLLGDTGTAVFFDDPKGGQSLYGAYGASKAAQIALARSWQNESTKTGPRVEIVEPRPMATALRARFHPGEDRSTLTPPMDEAKRLITQLFG